MEYKSPTLSVPVVAQVQGLNLARDATVIRTLDAILTLHGIDSLQGEWEQELWG